MSIMLVDPYIWRKDRYLFTVTSRPYPIDADSAYVQINACRPVSGHMVHYSDIVVGDNVVNSTGLKASYINYKALLKRAPKLDTEEMRTTAPTAHSGIFYKAYKAFTAPTDVNAESRGLVADSGDLKWSKALIEIDDELQLLGILAHPQSTLKTIILAEHLEDIQVGIEPSNKTRFRDNVFSRSADNSFNASIAPSSKSELIYKMKEAQDTDLALSGSGKGTVGAFKMVVWTASDTAATYANQILPYSNSFRNGLHTADNWQTQLEAQNPTATFAELLYKVNEPVIQYEGTETRLGVSQMQLQRQIKNQPINEELGVGILPISANLKDQVRVHEYNEPTKAYATSVLANLLSYVKPCDTNAEANSSLAPRSGSIVYKVQSGQADRSELNVSFATKSGQLIDRVKTHDNGYEELKSNSAALAGDLDYRVKQAEVDDNAVIPKIDATAGSLKFQVLSSDTLESVQSEFASKNASLVDKLLTCSLQDSSQSQSKADSAILQSHVIPTQFSDALEAQCTTTDARLVYRILDIAANPESCGATVLTNPQSELIYKVKLIDLTEKVDSDGGIGPGTFKYNVAQTSVLGESQSYLDTLAAVLQSQIRTREFLAESQAQATALSGLLEYRILDLADVQETQAQATHYSANLLSRISTREFSNDASVEMTAVSGELKYKVHTAQDQNSTDVQFSFGPGEFKSNIRQCQTEEDLTCTFSAHAASLVEMIERAAWVDETQTTMTAVAGDLKYQVVMADVVQDSQSQIDASSAELLYKVGSMQTSSDDVEVSVNAADIQMRSKLNVIDTQDSVNANMVALEIIAQDHVKQHPFEEESQAECTATSGEFISRVRTYSDEQEIATSVDASAIELTSQIVSASNMEDLGAQIQPMTIVLKYQVASAEELIETQSDFSALSASFVSQVKLAGADNIELNAGMSAASMSMLDKVQVTGLQDAIDVAAASTQGILQSQIRPVNDKEELDVSAVALTALLSYKVKPSEATESTQVNATTAVAVLQSQVKQQSTQDNIDVSATTVSASLLSKVRTTNPLDSIDARIATLSGSRVSKVKATTVSVEPGFDASSRHYSGQLLSRLKSYDYQDDTIVSFTTKTAVLTFKVKQTAYQVDGVDVSATTKSAIFQFKRITLNTVVDGVDPAIVPKTSAGMVSKIRTNSMAWDGCDAVNPSANANSDMLQTASNAEVRLEDSATEYDVIYLKDANV